MNQSSDPKTYGGTYEGSAGMSLWPRKEDKKQAVIKPEFMKEDKKEGVIKPEFITLKVVDQESRIIRHEIRTTDKLQAVMDRYYAEAPEVDYGTGTFVYEGTLCLRGCKTPADLKLEDGAQIDFFVYSDGGARKDDA